MSTQANFPDLLGDTDYPDLLGDTAMTGAKKKKKKSKKIIENIPNIPSQYAIDNDSLADGTSKAPIYCTDREDSSEAAVFDRNRYMDFATNTLPVISTRLEQVPADEVVDLTDVKYQDVISPEERKALKRKKRMGMKNRIRNMSLMGPKKSKVDVVALDENDSVFDRELEEITLNGGRDLEAGKPKGWRLKKVVQWGKKKKKKSLNPHYGDDENEKSWLVGTLFKDRKKKHKSVRDRMDFKILILGLSLLSVILISVAIAKTRGPGKPRRTALSPKQQQLQSILTRITGEKTLTETGTAQNKARNWLLFEDKESHKASRSEGSIIQRFALACFYFATSGDNDNKSTWKKNNWLKGPECGGDNNEVWFGLDCNSDGEIRAMALDSFGLSGTIPPEAGHLYKLENLILKNSADLKGWIPSTFSNLENLRQLGLYNNTLSGVIPDIFEQTTSLKFINLESNDLHGSIPLEIAHLSSLETLALQNNRMEGIVPFKQLASTSIKYLGLSNNHFASRIEPQIYAVETLEYLYLDNNSMKGSVPSAIGSLTQLKAIDLGYNEFSGFFPGTVGNLKRLEYLSLNHNKFGRFLPLRVSELSNLRTLNVASNTFTGTVPDLSNLVNLKSLHLYENDFSGPLPQSLQSLKSIESLFLSSNRFTGTIPESISLMSRTLTGLYLSDNYFEGTIPTHLCEFIGLEALFLDSNKFSGPIPSCFGGLSELKQLYLFKNELTGTVPQSLHKLKQLTGVGIEANKIVGAVPDDVCSVVHHQNVDMWADCGPTQAVECPCCSVCCPGDQCTH